MGREVFACISEPTQQADCNQAKLSREDEVNVGLERLSLTILLCTILHTGEVKINKTSASLSWLYYCVAMQHYLFF